MNLYIRYFDDETLVYSVEEALHFLSSLDEVEVTEEMAMELEKFMQSSAMYPKHIKVRSRSFFIAIKTTARTMEEFKAYAAEGPVNEEGGNKDKESLNRALATENPGWYRAMMKFKRVLPVENTNKFRYVDTDFEVKLKAHSVQDCYNRIVDHLRTRADVDPRSQFPSIRGRNFKAEFLGITSA